jgi:cell division protein FtsI (penicillin-binding protein 3)
MKNYLQKKVRKRTVILVFFFSVWLCFLLFRLIQLQVINHPILKAEVLQQHQNKNTIKPKRGTIFDRNGTILARSVPKYSVFFQPFDKETSSQHWKSIQKLRSMLRLPWKKWKSIQAQIEKKAPFIWIARKIEDTKAARIQALELNGIYLMEENKRIYPQRKRAAHVLGRVDIDEKGISGIEYKYNSTLQGKEGSGLIMRDAKRRRYRFETLKEPTDGKDLLLTLDETIQYIAEKELEAAVTHHRAEWGTIIVSVPATGEILALANHPTFDLNHPPLPLTTLFRNKAIHHNYDPGSTFKIVTASAAWEYRSVRLDDTFDCSPGYLYYAGNTFHDHHKFNILSFPQVIIHSSNVGTIQVGQQVGEENLYRMIKSFHFGQKTGIDLPAEEKGLLIPLEKWSNISIASHSIGYEISVTPIQMLQALNVVANKGRYIPPHIVKKNREPSSATRQPLASSRQVISGETALLLQEILEEAVLEGTGKEAQIQGYRVIGKTGTAQKYDPAVKKYLSTSHIASFVGFVCKKKPLFSIIVVIDDPKDKYYGGQVAAPVFREAARKILLYLGISPTTQPVDTLIASRKWRPEGE